VSITSARLSPGEWAVLGLLAEEPRHGFGLAKAMAPDGDIGRVWALSTPLVYRALSTLQAKGMATTAGVEHSDLGPQRQLMCPTGEGLASLADWLAEPVRHVRDTRSLLMLKLAFIIRSGADPEPLLRAQELAFRPVLERFQQQAEEAEPGFDRMLLLWRVESVQAAVAFLKRAPEAMVRRAAGRG
jgi:DNA-binding PadR family transcriptional regulator